MRAEIKKNGELVLYSEDGTEAYALEMWLDGTQLLSVDTHKYMPIEMISEGVLAQEKSIT